MTIQLDKRFKNNVAGRFGKYTFEVGILDDTDHKDPKRGVRGLKGKDVLSSYSGGPIRKKSAKSSGKSIAEVSKDLRKHLGFNYFTKPFSSNSNSQRDVLNFTNEFFKLAFGRSEKKRAENLLQAIVRNPILRKEYKRESKVTQAIKGFSRPLIDTAQLFKAIKARCTITGGKGV